MPRLARLWRSVAGALVLVLASGGCATTARHIRSTGAAEPHSSAGQRRLVDIGAGLEGPPGLRASVYSQGLPTVAGFAFDSSGRLWASAAGLENNEHDGVYLIPGPGQAPRLVISGLKDPLGLSWFHGRLYVSSVGRVGVYWGFDGTRFDRQTTLIHGPVANGENNELVMGAGGRFLMGVSASCDHCSPRSRWSGSIVSFRPNGTDLKIYARAIRAPVGLAYLPGTRELFATMNQPDDLGDDTPGDLLAEVREGENWRFPKCYEQGGPECRGVPAPVAILDKHAAVSGVAFATGRLAQQIGKVAVVAEWNVGKLLAVELSRGIKGYAGNVSQLLEGIQRPMAVTTAPNDGLIVGDWQTGRIYEVQAARTPGA